MELFMVVVSTVTLWSYFKLQRFVWKYLFALIWKATFWVIP